MGWGCLFITGWGRFLGFVFGIRGLRVAGSFSGRFGVRFFCGILWVWLQFREVFVSEFMDFDGFDDEFVGMLAVDGNGAVEAALPEGVPLRVVLIGPIKVWWGRMDSVEYAVFSQWRDAVRAVLIYHGCLVYSPHRAWSGAWHESAQVVNDAAIVESDVVVNLTPVGVEAVGTAAEVAVAGLNDVPVFDVPPGGKEDLVLLVERLRGLRG